MKRFFYIIAVVLFAGSLYGQPLDARATVKSLDLTVQVFIKATTAVSFPNTGNAISMNVAISLPANGATNTSSAPVPVTTTTPLTGLSVTSVPVALVNDRFVYTRILTGSVPAMADWAANSENLVLQMTFDVSVNGDKPRLDNLDPEGAGGPSGQDYFYFEVNGTQRSDTTVDPFYDGVEGQYSPTQLYVEAIAPLPITLIAFSAEKFQNRSSYLTWSTSSEINSSHFNVQRSFDNKTFTTVGKVSSSGNSHLIQNYEFLDQNVYNGTDARLTAFYRLQAVDIDGQMKNSPIKSVVFTGVGNAGSREVAVYPNPSSDGVYVEWELEGVDQPSTLEFFDINGKLVYTRKVAENSNQEYIDFSQTSIIPGLYIMRVMTATEAIDHKQIVVDKR